MGYYLRLDLRMADFDLREMYHSFFVISLFHTSHGLDFASRF